MYKYTKDPNGSKHTVILSLQSERKNLVNGLLVPQTFSDHSMTVRKYQYRILSSDRTEHITAPPISGKFVIHAPSLIGILAYAILANAPSASGMILEKAWTDSNSWLLAHLYYERMRFGSDVESPYFCKLIRRAKLCKTLPHLTIGQWLTAISQMHRRRAILRDCNFFFWNDRPQSTDIYTWLSTRLCS
ncbi:MAG: hypothetical protein JSC085_000890 [Candidatus Tokpelaia sp. JSC085]|nr:MAG: hypothetical protein JSC085_000890 [Candidatus Tokpelaia sp. JSC085]